MEYESKNNFISLFVNTQNIVKINCPIRNNLYFFSHDRMHFFAGCKADKPNKRIFLTQYFGKSFRNWTGSSFIDFNHVSRFVCRVRSPHHHLQSRGATLPGRVRLQGHQLERQHFRGREGGNYGRLRHSQEGPRQAHGRVLGHLSLCHH